MLTKTIHHIDKGETEMYAIDANDALARHPLEWSEKPWTDGARSKARAELEKQNGTGQGSTGTVLSTNPDLQGALDPNKLEARHRGRGSWSIMRGDEELKEGLSKDDAEAFNALSDEEKAEYVKS